MGRASAHVLPFRGSAGPSPAFRVVLFGLFLVLLVAGSVAAQNTATVKTIVQPPNGNPTITLNTAPLNCSMNGTNVVDLKGTYGSAAQCRSLCANSGSYEGTYRVYGQVSGLLCDAGGYKGCTTFLGFPSCTNIPPLVSNISITNTPSTTPTAIVDFCVQQSGNSCSRVDDYCDCSPPTNQPVVTQLPVWYRDSQQVTANYSETGGGRAYQVRFTESPSTGSYSGPQLVTCPGVNTASASQANTFCSVPLTVRIATNSAQGTACTQNGASACTATYTPIDYWNLPGPTLTARYNVDTVAPGTTFDKWSRPQEYTNTTSGMKWFRDQVGYQLTCADNLGAAQSSGCQYISSLVEPQATQCPSSATSYSSYPHVPAPPNTYSSPADALSCTGQDCPLKVCYFSDDAALSAPGNVETQKASETVSVDALPSTTTNRTTGGFWRSSDFTVTLSCSDGSGSGCAAIHYLSNKNSNTVSCSGPFTRKTTSSTMTTPATCPGNQACKFSICYYGEDNVGHLESPRPHSTLYGVDRQDPTIGAFSAPALVASQGKNWSGPGTVTIKVPASDGAGSGIGSCEYRVTNGGSTGPWRAATCNTGSAVFGSEVPSTNVTFPIVVGAAGSGADCSTEGANTCTVEVRVNDSVGNPQTASFSFGVDLTPPACSVANVQVVRIDPKVHYGYYNASSNTLFYGTPPSLDPYVVSMSSNESMGAASSSGVRSIAFPDLTSAGGTNLSSPPLYPSSFDASRSYSFSSSSTQNGTFTFTVTDAVGNAATCDLKLYHDVVEPRVWQGDVNYSRMVAENASVALAHLELWAHLNATDQSGIQAVEIKEQNATRFASPSGKPPQCDWSQPADPARDRTIAFVPNGIFGPVTETTIGAANWTRLAANVTAEAMPGSCLRFYGVVYDNAGNVNSSAPRDKSVAFDAYPGNSPAAACSFFSTFDNCNDRSAYLDLNSSPVQQYLTTACPGSCIEGQVHVVKRSGETVNASNSQVSVQGITGKPWYRNVSGPNGYYRIFNVSDPTAPGSTSRSYNFQATPPPAFKLFYAPAIVPRSIDERPYVFSSGSPQIYSLDFDIGLTPSDCTSSCTLSTDPGIGTCHVGCAGYNGCVNASGGPGFNSSSIAYKALEACDGLPLNSQTSNGTASFACCTQRIAAPTSTLIDAVSVENASHIVRNERLVYLNGRIVKMVTILFKRKS